MWTLLCVLVLLEACWHARQLGRERDRVERDERYRELVANLKG